jgi:PKD repeat protein
MSFSVGLIVEDWETGNFDQYEWETGGNAEWLISDQNPFEGNFCVKSGTIDDEEYTSLTISFNVLSNGEIGFYKKVSSEATYDFLKFYIDNNVMDQWSGDSDWSEVFYAVSSGQHTFKWAYEKDQSVSSGSDCAWVDFITLPSGAMTALYAGFTVDATSTCEGGILNYSDASMGNVISWDWNFEGGTPATSTEQNPAVEYATAGTYDVSLSISDGSDTHTINMEDYINVVTTPVIPGIPQGPGSAISMPGVTDDYTTTGSPNANLYSWEIEPADAGTLTQNNVTCTVDWTDYWEGTATIKVKAINDCGESEYSAGFDVWVIIEDVRNVASENISVYPNPTSGQLNINFGKYTGQSFDVRIINSLGETVLELKNLSEESGIMLQNQELGIYFIFVSNSSVNFYEKIILK